MEQDTSVKTHPEYARLNQVYGRLTAEQIDEKLASMTHEIEGHRRVARREFTGNGGRRTGAAVSAEAARDITQERLLLNMYREDKFGVLE